MKKKELNQLRTKTSQQLEALAKKTAQEVFKLKMEQKTNRLKNVHLVGQKRHDLAKIKTILREKELANEAA